MREMAVVSYKALELQVALPRTFEAGKMLTDIQQRGLIAQTQLKADQFAIEERNRMKIEKANAKSKGKFGQNSSGHDDKGDVPNHFKHPYKGSQIDYIR